MRYSLVSAIILEAESIMKSRIYEYTNVYVRKEGELFFLEFEKKSEATFEQHKIFSSILNFGYIPFDEGLFKVSDTQIIDFWNYSKTSVLKNVDIEKFYSLLNIAAPYTSQIPTIKTEGAFFSDSYKMAVAWINDTSTGKMASAPKAYKRDGLELLNFEDETIGSIYPEYFELYELADEANNSWKIWNKSEKLTFLKKIKELSKARKILIPDSLEQSLEYMEKK